MWNYVLQNKQNDQNDVTEENSNSSRNEDDESSVNQDACNLDVYNDEVSNNNKVSQWWCFGYGYDELDWG